MRSLAALALLAIAGHAAAQQPDAALVERARAIHERAITIDTHDDIPGNFGTAAMNPCLAHERRQVDLPKMKAGGLDVAFFIVYVGQGPRTPEAHQAALQQALQKFDGIRAAAEQQCPNEWAIAYRADDVAKILASGRKVIAIGIENGYQLANDPANVQRFYDLGGRYLSVTHIGHNDLGDSSNPRGDDPASEHDGLTPLGEQVIREMNRVGMMVDVSHIGKATMLDIARITRAPMIASHSAAKSVNDNLRNLDDEQLDVIRRNGGVVQTVAFAGYVKNDSPEKLAALDAARRELGIGSGSMTAEQREGWNRKRQEISAQYPVTVSDFVDHIDYMVKRIGIDHVGISSDFDGGGGVVGWNDAAESFNVTLELVRRGYSEADIHKLWGGNLLRVWREVEKVAGK